MRRPTVRDFGLLAAAAALLMSTTVSAATLPPSASSVYAKQKRTTTLAGLSLDLQRTAVRKARTRPGAPTLTSGPGTQQAGPSDDDLNDTCLEWFITWDEDANGNPIIGSFNLHCDGSVIPLG